MPRPFVTDVDAFRAEVMGRSALRDLPWRRTRDPWAVLVAETMLQQTQVARVVPRWHAFLGRFPDVRTCAAARVGDVVDEWAGLGYNRRAVQLHAGAVAVCEDHGGEIPADLDALRSLPGIGAYTARAVLAFAFERDVAVVDTNVAAGGRSRRRSDAATPRGAGRRRRTRSRRTRVGVEPGDARLRSAVVHEAGPARVARAEPGRSARGRARARSGGWFRGRGSRAIAIRRFGSSGSGPTGRRAPRRSGRRRRPRVGHGMDRRRRTRRTGCRDVGSRRSRGGRRRSHVLPWTARPDNPDSNDPSNLLNTASGLRIASQTRVPFCGAVVVSKDRRWLVEHTGVSARGHCARRHVLRRAGFDAMPVRREPALRRQHGVRRARGAGADPIVLDLGTGLRFWGDTSPHGRQLPRHALVTHLHWDHVQGLPFFVPDQPARRAPRHLRPGAATAVARRGVRRVHAARPTSR